MIGLLLRGERRRLLCAPRTRLIVAGRLTPTDRGHQGLPRTPAPRRAVRNAAAQSRLLYSELIRRYFCLDFQKAQELF